MKRSKSQRAKTRPPEELLAAYADGGVNDDERAVVEQYLDENPHAREELEAIRDLVTQARQAVPQPMKEPSWSGMARRIVAMCELEEQEAEQEAEQQAEQRADRQTARQAEQRIRQNRGIWQWLAHSLRPRHAIGFAAAVVVGIVLFAVLGTDRDTGQARDSDPSIADRQAGHTPGKTPGHTATAPGPDTRPGVDWDQIDQILQEGLDEDLDEDLDTEPDLLASDGTDDAEELEYAAGPSLDLFAEPDYASWLDDLSADELDALDDLLREAQAG